MSENLLDQQPVWEHRAATWDRWAFGEPLAPNKQELEYQQQYIKSDNNVLVLGATKGLCAAMLEKTNDVTSVDFSNEAIKLFHIDGVKYVCRDWITFLEDNPNQYDNIVTDNGLLCLEFPDDWRRISDAIRHSLKPNGIFCSRFFISTETPVKDEYDNPNLTRLLPAMGRAAIAPNWTVIKPANGDYDPYPARYVFPSKDAVKNMFDKFSIIDELTPEYEEGEHFITIAFSRD